ncbi:23S rRNA (guanosine(2251)-2'-O)-methyltransferase RlmB [uncultured Draconibacterium sp.]|uniref:23S rRNA (guanosine(2251)-2'-O)-methyltransferase RlmB n=1 Tax=uncultured Draconibacterium sp. TaxID=1573823 RepID=UPI0029C6F1EA|nr:23S rRNA (guanosine(2251)-2'-O)-methyltransferase RlmB [uncultured Draconibacterium sp.]
MMRQKGIDKEDFLFGTRAIIEAIKKGKTIDRILIKKGLRNELISELQELIKESDISVQYVPIEKINRITRKNHQGVLAFVSPIEFDNIETVIPGIYEEGKTPLLLVLDQITDVRNFGAIARSAECAGVQAIIIPEKGMARIGADAVKTSAGAIHNIPICRTNNLYHTVRFLKDSGIKIVAATEKGDKLYSNADMKSPLAIVMGSEDTGVSAQILKLADEQLKIPILGQIESLNVSVSAALMIYEAVRQRNQA